MALGNWMNFTARCRESQRGGSSSGVGCSGGGSLSRLPTSFGEPVTPVDEVRWQHTFVWVKPFRPHAADDPPAGPPRGRAGGRGDRPGPARPDGPQGQGRARPRVRPVRRAAGAGGRGAGGAALAGAGGRRGGGESASELSHGPPAVRPSGHPGPIRVLFVSRPVLRPAPGRCTHAGGRRRAPPAATVFSSPGKASAADEGRPAPSRGRRAASNGTRPRIAVTRC